MFSFGKFKTYGLIALSIVATVLFALFKSEQAGRAKEKLKGEIQARKTGEAANKAMIEGKNREDTEIDKVRNSNDPERTGFE